MKLYYTRDCSENKKSTFKIRYPTLFFIIVSCTLFSCEKSADSPYGEDRIKENILRFDVHAPITSLNPVDVDYSGSTCIFPLLYSYLFTPKANGELRPDLATEWRYDSDTFEWIIHLRKDALFHNKKPVTSGDVTYSLSAYLKKIRPELFSQIDKLYVLTDTSFCIKLKNNSPSFLKKIWDIEVISYLSNAKSKDSDAPIGSGPFRFKSRMGEKEVKLVSNKDYYDTHSFLNGIIIHYEADKEKTWTRLLSGETDIAEDISPKNYEMILKYSDKFHFHRYTLNWYTLLLLNTTDRLFLDRRVRLALSYAIDREYILKHILENNGRIAVGPMGVDSPYHNPDLKPLPYNPMEGAKLLKEAGWLRNEEGNYIDRRENLLKFTVYFAKENQIEKKVARYIQLSLNDLGIKVYLKSLPLDELMRRYVENTEFQAVLTELKGAYRNPEDLKQFWSSNASKGAMKGCLNNQYISELFNRALNERSFKKQKLLYYEIESEIVACQPGLFLFHKISVNAISKRVRLSFPFSLDYEGIYRLKDAQLIDN